MITVTGSVETKLSAEKAFAFLSAFENTSEWDPNTPVMEKLTPGPVAVGHRYHAESEFRGKRQSLEYEVIELTGNHIKLRGENKTVTAFDSIDVSPAGQDRPATPEAGVHVLARPCVERDPGHAQFLGSRLSCCRGAVPALSLGNSTH